MVETLVCGVWDRLTQTASNRVADRRRSLQIIWKPGFSFTEKSSKLIGNVVRGKLVKNNQSHI